MWNTRVWSSLWLFLIYQVSPHLLRKDHPHQMTRHQHSPVKYENDKIAFTKSQFTWSKARLFTRAKARQISTRWQRTGPHLLQISGNWSWFKRIFWGCGGEWTGWIKANKLCFFRTFYCHFPRLTQCTLGGGFLPSLFPPTYHTYLFTYVFKTPSIEPPFHFSPFFNRTPFLSRHIAFRFKSDLHTGDGSHVWKWNVELLYTETQRDMRSVG